MSKICQEKFEYRAPLEKPENRDWVSDQSARTKKGLRAGELEHYNCLPPGSDGEDQYLSDQRAMPLSMGGETDVSKDWNPEAVRAGFSAYKMRPTDDLYSNEHCDAFYGSVIVDGVEGFLERNNTLDRQ
jgi:hypothetical protein